MPDLPQAHRRLLAVDAGGLLAPVRAETFGLQRLAQHDRILGATIVGSCTGEMFNNISLAMVAGLGGVQSLVAGRATTNEQAA